MFPVFFSLAYHSSFQLSKRSFGHEIVCESIYGQVEYDNVTSLAGSDSMVKFHVVLIHDVPNASR